jgi:hypothetical protein
VRVDAASKNHRRTGRWVSRDFVHFSAAEQVFEGSGDDDQVYTVQPFRLPEWPAGQYLATAMFFKQDEKQGWVQAELIQTLNWGENWTRLAPKQQFIPLGQAGEFDSHTIYVAWSGEQAPTIDPREPNTTLFYYAGGDGPHSGQRDDSIGLARAVTHAYAGLLATPGRNTSTNGDRTAGAHQPLNAAAASRLVTGPLDELIRPPDGAGGAGSGGSEAAALAILASIPSTTLLRDGAAAVDAIRVGVAGADDDGALLLPVVHTKDPGLRWIPLPAVLTEQAAHASSSSSSSSSLRLVIEAMPGVTLYALRAVYH